MTNPRRAGARSIARRSIAVRQGAQPAADIEVVDGGDRDLNHQSVVLQARGPDVATVSIAIDALRLPHVPQPYVIAAHASVLGGEWAADGPEQVGARVRGLAPLRVLGPVTAIIDPLAPLLALFEPRLREFCPGTIAPEIVPPDRLVPRPPVRNAQWVRC